MNIPDQIRVAGNYIRTSTTTPFDSNDLAFDVYDPTKIESEGGLLEVEYDIPHKREVLYVLSKSGNTLTIADDGRGLYGTNAQDHPANSNVRDFFVDDHINQFVPGITNISNTLNGGFTGNAVLSYMSTARLVMLHFDISGTFSGATHTHICTIDSNYLPTYTLYTAGTAGTAGWFQISVRHTDGYVLLWHPTGMSTPRGFISWFI
jgi:hypothetical protein